MDEAPKNKDFLICKCDTGDVSCFILQVYFMVLKI